MEESKTVKILQWTFKKIQIKNLLIVIGIVGNIIWNSINHRENLQLNAEVKHQTFIIGELKSENKDLKLAIESLLENMVDYNRSFEDFDLEVFNKVKKKDTYISNYYNLAYESAHFTPKGSNRYANMGKTDFDNVPKWMAALWFRSDSIVAVTGKSNVYTEPYFHPKTQKITWGNFYKWRRLANTDTLIYGLKLPKYKTK